MCVQNVHSGHETEDVTNCPLQIVEASQTSIGGRTGLLAYVCVHDMSSTYLAENIRATEVPELLKIIQLGLTQDVVIPFAGVNQVNESFVAIIVHNFSYHRNHRRNSCASCQHHHSPELKQ